MQGNGKEDVIGCKFKTTTVERVPQWATTYIVYGDDSGLNEEDKKLVDDWLEKLHKKGLMPICPVDGSESEFEPYPAFGLASSTVDYTAEVIPKSWRVDFTEAFDCSVEVSAHSRSEAIAIAEAYIDGGSESWTSRGIKRKGCRPVAKGVA